VDRRNFRRDRLKRWIGEAFRLPQKMLKAADPVACSYTLDMPVFAVPEQWSQTGGCIPGRRTQISA
jgi:hypothetical protein